MRQYERHLSVSALTVTEQPMGKSHSSINFFWHLAEQLKNLEKGGDQTKVIAQV